jgi:hypothetical protein
MILRSTVEVKGEKTMRRFQHLFSLALAAALIAASVSTVFERPAFAQRRTTVPPKASPQNPSSVYGQGYQKGYLDGFAQGELDWRRKQPRDYKASEAFVQRESAYDRRYAGDEEYTLGYELGFELGHADGYLGRAQDPSVPANGEVIATATVLAKSQRERRRSERRESRQQAEQSRINTILSIPHDTELRIRLDSPISTIDNRVGDKFRATVVAPPEFEGAIVEGHIATLRKSGRVSGKTELGLAFDAIYAADDRSIPIEANLVNIIESEKVKKVDEEGRVETGNRTEDSTVRGGIGAVAGAVIGGIAGGGKGAVLGAIIGGAAGVGTVAIEGSKDLILDAGTEMIIRIVKSGSR